MSGVVRLLHTQVECRQPETPCRSGADRQSAVVWKRALSRVMSGCLGLSAWHAAHQSDVVVDVDHIALRAVKPRALGEEFVSGNGRIEAVGIDVSAKAAGRVTAVLANEGDLVTFGQVIAEMDVSVLTAQRQEALARLAQARRLRSGPRQSRLGSGTTRM